MKKTPERENKVTGEKVAIKQLNMLNLVNNQKEKNIKEKI